MTGKSIFMIFFLFLSLGTHGQEKKVRESLMILKKENSSNKKNSESLDYALKKVNRIINDKRGHFNKLVKNDWWVESVAD